MIDEILSSSGVSIIVKTCKGVYGECTLSTSSRLQSDVRFEFKCLLFRNEMLDGMNST